MYPICTQIVSICTQKIVNKAIFVKLRQNGDSETLEIQIQSSNKLIVVEPKDKYNFIYKDRNL